MCFTLNCACFIDYYMDDKVGAKNFMFRIREVALLLTRCLPVGDKFGS